MDQSRLSMSKLAAESGLKNERSKSDRENISGNTGFNRLQGFDSVKENTAPDSRNDEDRLYQEGMTFCADAFAAVQAEKPFPAGPAVELVKKIIASLNGSNMLLVFVIHKDYQQDSIIHHSLNVAIISIMIARHMGISDSVLLRLGTAALAHDIGTARIPEKLFNKPTPLTNDELQKLRQRTHLSQQILEQLGDEYAYLPDIAFQVYERLDGSGYPLGLKGDEINEFAQIIGLADLYEALVHSRPHRDRFLHFTAIRDILRSGKQAFDRKLLKALVGVVDLFPIYSCVRLNSGAVGRVLETFSRDPLRPRVKILFDAQKKQVLSERLIDLRENPLLFIVDAVSEEAVNSAPL